MPETKMTQKKLDQKKPRPKIGNSPVGASKNSKAEKFPVVGLGASAGGLEALKSFFSKVTKKSGMAYIVVVHMTPKQPSMMPQLLQNVAAIPATSAIDSQMIEPNHIYVIPPDNDITMFRGKIQLLDKVRKNAALPIDLFLRSLAQDQESNAAAIILSGTGSDGTLGVKEIKAKDGLVLVQSEKSAGYDGMPRSAISTGLVDMVLPPEEMPIKLVQYFRHSKRAMGQKRPTTATSDQREWLNKIFSILRTQIGHDFSVYKVNTILRRIDRRMGLNHIDSYKTYVRYLRENSNEVEALFRELLIGVTNFFRDAESFDVLKTRVLPELLGQMKADSSFRAWVPGCSTGEEVYSLAMVFRECLDKNPRRIDLQLFGTDIDNYAIDKAREGLYPASIAADLSPERLKRFFIKEGDFFRTRKEIRDCVVFSVQDVIKDPPFSRLNLLCCRNLLIYLDTDAQKKVLPLFHYTLKPDGVLMLGSSETIGGFGNLFKSLDKKWKIFRRREVPQALRQIVDFPSGIEGTEPAYDTSPVIPAPQRSDISQLTKNAILAQFAPAAILTDAKGEILNIQGRTGKYLETPSGPPTHNILDLAREGLRIELSSALRAARSSADKVTRKQLSVKTNGDVQWINLHVSPQKSPKELAGRFLVAFEEIDTAAIAKGSGQFDSDKLPEESSRITELERELQVTREGHQTTIEELESSNEELKSTNEEMQSSNEELQSTNEELESSKEELQSLNEELQTVNAELHSKVEELSAAHDDMRNLLNSTEIATIFVDNNQRIRRFTTEATTIVNLIQTDIGRPLEHVVTNLNYFGMIPDLTEVLNNLTSKEVEVQTDQGEWYNMRVMPYRTTDNRIDGAVLTFSSITDQKRAQDLLQTSIHGIEHAQELVRAVFDMNTDPMAVLDSHGKIIIANTSFSELMNISQDDLGEIDYMSLQAGLSKGIAATEKIKTALTHGKNFQTRPFQIETAQGTQTYVIHGRVIKKDAHFPYRILLNFVESAER